MEGKLKHGIFAFGVVAGALLFTGTALADGFQDHVEQCVEKFASSKYTASVTLECTAGGGKLSGCKVVDETMAGKGFDKAAVCVADFLPMGSKTGPVRVPLKFEAS
jgi:hypothetical protein